jgi:hypothetical protein
VAIGAGSTLLFALIALVQRTLHGLLRASMLMHGGMLFAAVGAAGRGHHAAAMLVAITLGLALSGFGIMLASFEARVGPLTQLAPGGRARAFPRLAAAVAIFGGAAVGLPGTAGFVADDLLLHALWQESAASAVITIVASALLRWRRWPASRAPSSADRWASAPRTCSAGSGWWWWRCSRGSSCSASLRRCCWTRWRRCCHTGRRCGARARPAPARALCAARPRPIVPVP